MPLPCPRFVRPLLALPLLCGVGCSSKKAPQAAASGGESTQDQVVALADAWKDGDGPTVPIPQALQQPAADAAWRGTWIYRMDVATARGSDVLAPYAQEWGDWAGIYFARVEEPLDVQQECCFVVHFPTVIDEEFHRWLTVEAGWYAGGRAAFDPNVSWVDQDGQPVEPGSQDAQPDTLKAMPPEPEPYDADIQARLNLMYQMASSDLDLPWDRYNMLALEEAELGRAPLLHLYLIPATTDPNTMILSGWVAVHVEHDADSEPTVELLGTAPLAVPRQSPEGQELAFIFVTSITEPPTPTEAHVFASWMYDKPVLVLAGELLWRVDHDDVALIGRITP